MADLKLTIPEKIREFLASTIASTGGNEVFFLAKVAWEGPEAAAIEEVDVLARGNSHSAPAIVLRAESWDLAIHNHPSGVLTPSDGDIAVAGELGNRQVGFAIIDNTAERHYLVVPPMRRRDRLEKIDPAEVEAIFAPGGPLAAASSDYEVRPGQVAMAREVAEALNGEQVAAIEAGTGVGKSYAYLVPSILWAVKNGQRVIVSTNTIHLQEQLIAKDLPFLTRVLPVQFHFALIKGRSNYACKRKLEEAERATRELVEADGAVGQLRNIVEWARTASEGSRSELGAPPPEAVWEKAMSETDKSLKVNCKFYGECFYYRAKRAAYTADIVVVNHHLFFADLAVRRETGNYEYDAVIPGYKRVIFDEAHHLEDVASQFLGVRFTQQGMRNRFNRLVSSRDSKKGALRYLAQVLHAEGAPAAAKEIEKGLLESVPKAAQRIDDELSAALDQTEAEAQTETRGAAKCGETKNGRGGAVQSGATEASGRQLHVRVSAGKKTFQEALNARLAAVREELAALCGQAGKAARVLSAASNIPEERRDGLLLELTSLHGRLESLQEQIATFLDFRDKKQVRWVEVQGRRDDPDRRNVVFSSAPIRVAEDLLQLVFNPLATVVMASATLSVEGGVSYLGERLGLDRLGGRRFRFTEQPSPFDFANQVLTLVPDDFPEPGSAGYEGKVAEVVLEILRRSHGRAFVLFTSYGLLQRTHAALEATLRREGITPLRQGEAGRSDLLHRFRSGPPHALFGTDSFWEGVDVKGEALECVIITRLPFRVPTEPIQVARVEEIEARGGDAFNGYSVPQAVLKFKQGFGRLIRSTTDRGTVVVLDRRIVTKRYGQTFLRSLPPTRFFKGPTAEMLRSLGAFLGRAGEPTTIPASDRL